MLNEAEPWLICTRIDKFGNRNDNDGISVGGKKAVKSLDFYLEEVAKNLPQGFQAKGNTTSLSTSAIVRRAACCTKR